LRKAYTFRLEENLVNRLKDEANKKGISLTDLLTQALNHFLNCDKIEQSPSMKMILLRYPTQCLKCGNKISPYSWALYGRGVGAICLDCYVQRLGDKTLVAKYLKVKELNRLIKALKSEADRLSDELETLTINDKIKQLEEQSKEVHQLALSYLKDIGSFLNKDERRILEELAKLTENEMEILRNIDLFLTSKIGIKTKKKVKQYTH